IAPRRLPGPAAAAAPGALRAGPDQRALWRARLGEALRLVIGAADDIETLQSVKRRQSRRIAGHRANRAAAAASAPPTIGSGSRTKNRTTTAVRIRTPFNSI